MAFSTPLACNVSSDCGEHASCVDLFCQCDALWSNHADFVETNDCMLSAVGIYLLWTFNLLLICYVLWKTSFIVVARIENFFLQKRLKRGYTLWANKGLIAVLVYFSLCLPAHVILCIAHFADPFMRIGFDVLPTVCFFLTKLGFYIAVIFTQGPFLAATLKGSPQHEWLVRRNYQVTIGFSSVSIFLGGMPFIILNGYQTDVVAQMTILEFYYFVLAGTLGFNAFLAYAIKQMVFRSLNTAARHLASDEKTIEIKKKISALQDGVVIQGSLQCVIYVLMGAIPFLVTKHAYFLPMSFLALPMLGKSLAMQINLDKAGTRTIMERFGIKNTGTGTGSNNMSSGHVHNQHSASAGVITPFSKMKTGSFSENNPIGTSDVTSNDN